MNRVVVTGIGAVTPIGNSAAQFARGLLTGEVGSSDITDFSAEEHYLTRRAFKVQNFSPLKNTKALDPYIQYILHAAEEALEDSRLDLSSIDKKRFGITASSSKGGVTTFERLFNRFQKRPSALLAARIYANIPPNIAAQWISRRWQLEGPAKPVVAACATGLYSIFEGVRMIEQDEADFCIAGAGDASITRLMTAGYKQMGILADSQIRPFDFERSGFLLGEGAGILILEKKESAEARGAKIYGEILAHTYGFDASNPLSFDTEANALSDCLKKTLKQADITARDLDYFNLHGTATKHGDAYETDQIKSAFGKAAHEISMSSTKSLVGHMVGASGAIEVIACLLAMRGGFVPPTMGLETPDPKCDLNYTPGRAVRKKINRTCSISMGLGGQLGAIILSK